MKITLFSTLCLILCWPLFSLAQLPSLSTGGNIAIDTTPNHPRPGQTFSASLNDFSTGISGGSIDWFLNGQAQPEFKNQRSIELTAPALGERLTVRVLLTPPQGSSLEASTTITPAVVDIIVEPDTHVPDFYVGRPLPSPHSSVRAVAVAHTNERVAGYTWRLNGKTLGGGSSANNSLQFTVPLGREATLSVEALNREGSIIARRAVALPIVEPELRFYENNALKGLVERPLQNGAQFIGSETMVTAVPYFMPNNVFARNPLIEWEIDGTSQATDPQDPLTLPVTRSAVSGNSFRLGFQIRDLNNLLVGAGGQLQARF